MECLHDEGESEVHGSEIRYDAKCVIITNMGPCKELHDEHNSTGIAGIHPWLRYLTGNIYFFYWIWCYLSRCNFELVVSF